MNYGHEVQRDVAALYLEGGAAIGETPGLRDVEVRTGQLALASQRTIKAAEGGDLVGALVGLSNVVRLAYGAATTWGVDLKPFIDEVHRLNAAALAGETPQSNFAGILRDQIVAAPASGNFTSIIGQSGTAALR